MSSIAYLAEVRGDLLDAGRRDFRRRGGRPVVGLRDRFRTRTIVAVASVVTLLAAGTLGWFMTNGDVLELPLSGGGDEVSAGGAAPSADHQTIREGELSRPAVPAPEAFSPLQPGWSVDYSAGNASTVNQRGPVDVPAGAIVPELSRVIRTAELGLVIPPDAFGDRFAQVMDVASDNDGFVATSTSRERSGNVTMRVPADNFTQTLQDLRALGDVEVQTIQGRDVTAEYVDLRARMRIAKSRRQVLLRLMDRATSIEQTIRVQNALDETQLQLEGLQGQLRFLDDRTSLATIHVHLREEGVEIAAEVDTPSIPTALERSVAGFVGVIAGVVIGLGYLIPIALLAALVWFVWTRVRVRRAGA